MSSTKFFQFPWATSGDKAVVPDTVQVDGSVSYPEGFGVGYELKLGVDAAAKPVPRPESNQLYFDITSNIRALQLAGLPEWVTAAQNGGVAVAYPKAALVRHDYTGAFLAYFANVATSAEPGTSADWSTLVTKEYVDSISVPVGAVMGFDLGAPPTGWLAGDGAAVLRSSYAALDAAKYVGDANNATATAWYRCTNPASPGATRSTTGAYLVTRDLRGVFIRHLDAGRGIDAGRVLGSLQKGTIISFDTATGATGDGVWGGGAINNPTLAQALAQVGADAYQTSDYSGVGLRGVTATENLPLPGPLGAKCGSGVTRPVNVALLGCIKY